MDLDIDATKKTQAIILDIKNEQFQNLSDKVNVAFNKIENCLKTENCIAKKSYITKIAKDNRSVDGNKETEIAIVGEPPLCANKDVLKNIKTSGYTSTLDNYNSQYLNTLAMDCNSRITLYKQNEAHDAKSINMIKNPDRQ